MLRQHETLARTRFLGRPGCRTFTSRIPLGIVCLALVAVDGPIALAAPRSEPAPQRLWNEYPLNPTGERLVQRGAPRAGRSVPFTPPQRGAVAASPTNEQPASDAPAAASRLDLILLAFLAGVGLLALVALASRARVQLRSASSHHRAHAASVWLGTGAVGPVLGAGGRRLLEIFDRARRHLSVGSRNVTRRVGAGAAGVARVFVVLGLGVALILGSVARLMRRVILTPEVLILGASAAAVFLIHRYVG
jgi:hypothetical protein